MTFKFSLQTLPGTARALRKDARLAKDTTRAVELAAWTATSPMAREGGGVGPLPIIFSPDAVATKQADEILKALKERELLKALSQRLK